MKTKLVSENKTLYVRNLKERKEFIDKRRKEHRKQKENE